MHILFGLSAVCAMLLLIHPAFINRKKIEDVSELHEEYIRSLHSLPMEHFESEIWHKFGHKFIAETNRRKVVLCIEIQFSFSLLSDIFAHVCS
jgi:hypothetical protein